MSGEQAPELIRTEWCIGIDDDIFASVRAVSDEDGFAQSIALCVRRGQTTAVIGLTPNQAEAIEGALARARKGEL